MSRIGHYELIDRFATGGVAEIYRARDVRSDALVVIKKLRTDTEFNRDEYAGFLQELQLAMRCTHKNLIQGFEKGTTDGIEYGVLEYVDGQDLHAIIHRARKNGVAVPAEFATFIVAEILDGLDFAWKIKDERGRQLGLVHRDVAPKNVFIRYDGQVRIGDFGSAVMSLLEQPDTVLGTAGFMSPEQASLARIDQRTDVFAAGCILFELLTGQAAFDLAGKKDAAILKMHQKAQRRHIPAELPEDLALVLEIATAASPEDRYQSAQDMLRGLRQTDARPDPVQAMPGLATLVRRLFAEEYAATRLPGGPLLSS